MAIHRFEPDRYYVTLGSHPPVLEIADGDTVVTTTVDARGYDSSGAKVTDRGNPLTGPFYINGAEPGDTLLVTFDEITPSRDHGFSRSQIASSAVDPNYVPQLPADELSQWNIDCEKGLAILTHPDTHLGEFSLPLNPMLGCFGVAPGRGQAISAGTSGPYGGNMDHNGFVSGVTVHLPVFVPGALFFLGDGHALQGDGEILGTGIEISMNVRFTVRLLKEKNCSWPRGETDQEIFTVGNARPISQAFQHATTEMLVWLQEDFGLDPWGANLLIGQAVQYRIGNIFNPVHTGVCSLSKSLLPT